MDFNSTLMTIGEHAVSLLDVLLTLGALALLLLISTVILAYRAMKGRGHEQDETARRTMELEFRLAELSGALQNFAAQSQGNTVHLQRTLDEKLEAVGQRVGLGLTEQSQRTTQSLNVLNERLAVIDAAQRNITSLSTEMVGLKDILSNKQSRGAFGQGRMEAIIRDGLHSKAYEFQPTLSNGTRPDCLICLPDTELKLVIDAKFPLEAHSAWRESQDEAPRKEAGARLRSDIAKHVKDISEKYLLAGETQDTAIMFVPSESVYADLHEHFEDVVQKAHRARVILASPNVLMLIVQTMQAIVKDVAMRDQAHIIKQEVTRLLEDVTRLKERSMDLRRHFDMASGDLEKLGVTADKISKRGVRIESLDLEEPAKAAALEGNSRPRLISGS
jgi:DNA recombination protein RmuC